MSEQRGEIIALMPAFNEARYISSVVSRVSAYLPVVVIDDGSTDGTGAHAAMAGAKVIAHRSNMGKGKALNTGFAYAVKRGVDAAITIDADGQHDPDEIPRFIEAYRSGLGDVIIGQRTFSQMPAKSRWGNRIGTFLISAAMGRHIPDNQSGYRLLSRAVMAAVRPETTRFEAEVELLLRAHLAGFRLSWIPIKTIYNDKVSHYRPVRDSLLFLKMVFHIWRTRVSAGGK
jgi:glycosyltransferase involved in cell wall biosynthesis